ncbi:helix-turn-helix domain-containing protein [Micromonospora coerulea]|uniref:helix-turn-helix domain-containing protein n=1 Tax=Micromonospora coerulea TaxID=47856 RepID=UPI0019032A70|nr:helix-turn-helix domain-containing protein [Micromonospora veneta]
MSLEAIVWALHYAPDVPPSCLAVLLGLANHAHSDGRGAHPSQERLAHYARKSVRSVRNDLAELQRRGLIRRGDQRHAAFVPLDRRPVVWELAIERRRTVPPAPAPEIAVEAERPEAPFRGSPEQPEAGFRSSSEKAESGFPQQRQRPEADFPTTGSVLPNGRKHASYKPSLTIKEPRARRRPRRSADRHCPRHRGSPAHNCGPCRSEALGGPK